MAKHISLSDALLSRVLLEQQIEAAGCLVTALEDRAILEGLWVTAPAVKNVVIIPCHGLQDFCFVLELLFCCSIFFWYYAFVYCILRLERYLILLVLQC